MSAYIVDEEHIRFLVTAAKNMRLELRRAFPGVKFEVRSDRFSGGDSIDVRWRDGPTTEAVDKIAKKYKSGTFDGMQDLYEDSDSPWLDVFGDAKYVQSYREYSGIFVRTVMAANGFAQQVTVKENGNGDAWIEALDNSTDHWARKALAESTPEKIAEVTA